MDYAALSPHVGSWALRDDHLGDSSLRGGAINWGNLGSRLSSALSSTGRWIYNAGNRFVHSQAFNQIKQGIKDSGVIQNAANLAGETLSALTDIGRAKLQQDLEKLRRKALGEDGPPNTAELQALIAMLQAQLAGTPQTIPVNEPPAGTPTPLVPTTRPIPGMVTEVLPPPAPTTRPMPGMVTEVLPPVNSSAPAVPIDKPTTLELGPPRNKRRRKRNLDWRGRLDSMTGSGVNYSSKRMCY